MKLVRYNRNETEEHRTLNNERRTFNSYGILTERGIIDIGTGWEGTNPPRDIADILKRGEEGLAKIRDIAERSEIVIPTEEARILAPIERPGKILALAGNYGEHIKEASLKRGFKLGLSDPSTSSGQGQESLWKKTVPRPFLKPGTTVIGPGDEIPWPAYSEQIDYEIELAVVIGREAKCVGVEEAMEYVAGYMIANDVSARSVTFKKGRKERPWDEFYDWLAGKWADGFCPMGPYLATRDEISDAHNLEMELRVNGEVRQKANTSNMIYSVAEVVSFLSHIMRLEAGDVILTGTPAGVAVATGRFLQPGDEIECNITGLGILKNALGQKAATFYEPLA